MNNRISHACSQAQHEEIPEIVFFRVYFVIYDIFYISYVMYHILDIICPIPRIIYHI